MSLVSLLRCSCIHWVQIWAPPAPLVQAIQSLNVSVTLSSSIHRSNVMLRILLMNGGQLSTGLNNKFLNKSLTDEPPGDEFLSKFPAFHHPPSNPSHLPRLAAPPPGFVWWCSSSRCLPGTHRAMTCPVLKK